MSLPNGYLPRKGDVLLIPATVTLPVDAGDENVHVKVNGYARASVDMKDVAKLVSCFFEVGDTVVSMDGMLNGIEAERGRIIAIHEGFAWVEFNNLLITASTTTLAPAPVSAEVRTPEQIRQDLETAVVEEEPSAHLF